MRRVVPLAFPDPLVEDAQAFGMAVRAARTASGMTLADAAMMTGVSKETLAALERGSAGVAIGTALRVGRELGVSVFAVPSGQREQAGRALAAALAGAKGTAP